MYSVEYLLDDGAALIVAQLTPGIYSFECLLDDGAALTCSAAHTRYVFS